MGVSRCRPKPGRHRRHTHPVCRLVSHIPSRRPVTLNVPATPASQRTVKLGGQTEDGAAGSYSNPYTREETGPVVPPCLENSTLTYIAQRPRTYVSRSAAHVHSAHAAYQLLEHRMHSHNPPSPWAGLDCVFSAAFCFMYTGE